MSGNNSDRDDRPPSGSLGRVSGSGGGLGGGGSGGCTKSYSGPINSPKRAVLGPLQVGATLDVVANTAGTVTSLEVHYQGNLAGAITFHGVFEIIDCILLRQRKYEATITSISAGQYIIVVDPI